MEENKRFEELSKKRFNLEQEMRIVFKDIIKEEGEINFTPYDDVYMNMEDPYGYDEGTRHYVVETLSIDENGTVYIDTDQDVQFEDGDLSMEQIEMLYNAIKYNH